MFLYILKLTKYNCIKIGVAKSYSRIKQHQNTYGEIDLEESYIIHAKNGDTIRILERQLLEDYIDYKVGVKSLMNKDGYTEIRDIVVLKTILEDIEYKSKRFKNKGISIVKDIIIPDNKTLSKISSQKTNIKSIITEDTVAYSDLIGIRSKLSLNQNKILDIVSTIVNYDNKQYMINIRDYSKMINSDTSNINRDIKKAIDDYNTLKFTVLLDNGSTKYIGDIIKIQYISSTIISVEVDDYINNYLCSLHNDKDDLAVLLNFNSIYSQRLYYYINEMIISNITMKIEKTDNLRNILNTPKTYLNFSNLKKFCLDVAEKEINNLSLIKFKYETLQNKSIYAISFKIY